MRFMCYTDKVSNIRIELTGSTVAMPKWQFIRDSAKKIFGQREWVKTVSFPKGRNITINTIRIPNDDQWTDVTREWLNVLAVQGIEPERFVDNDVVMNVSLPRKKKTTKKKKAEKRSVVNGAPSGVIHELQKAYWENIDKVLQAKKDVEKAREEWNKASSDLEEMRRHLCTIADFLDDDDGTEEDDKDSWVGQAIEKGALV